MFSLLPAKRGVTNEEPISSKLKLDKNSAICLSWESLKANIILSVPQNY